MSSPPAGNPPPPLQGSPGSDDSIDLEEALEQVLPILFGPEAEPPLTRMETLLITSAPAGMKHEFASLLPGGIVYATDFNLVFDTEAQAPRNAANAHQHRRQLQLGDCRHWLVRRGLVQRLPDGRTVVSKAGLAAALAETQNAVRVSPRGTANPDADRAPQGGGEGMIAPLPDDPSAAPPSGTVLKNARGPRADKRAATARRMTVDYQSRHKALSQAKEKTLAIDYGVSRETARKARIEAMTRLLGTPTNSDKTPTIDK